MEKKNESNIQINNNENKEKELENNINLNESLNLTRANTVSFKIPINENNNLSNYKRIRFYSENIPNFVPRLKPIKTEKKPSPLKLNHLNFKRNSNNIINEISELNEKLVSSFEKEDYSDLSEIEDSSDDEDLNFENNNKSNNEINNNNKNKSNDNLNCSFIQNLKKEMNKIKSEMKKNRKISFNDFDSESSKKSILEIFLEKENKLIYGNNNLIKRGFSIIQVLEQNSPHIELYKKLSFDQKFIL
jgi:hypothetical protein